MQLHNYVASCVNIHAHIHALMHALSQGCMAKGRHNTVRSMYASFTKSNSRD